MTNLWNPAAPLARLSGESDKANAALRDYALLGGGRSLRSLLDNYRNRGQTGGKPGADSGHEKPPTSRLSTLEEWSSRHHWQARVADWERLRYQERLVRRAEREAAWEDKAWETANALLEKAEQMLKFPIVQTETKDGHTTVVPARWSMDTISRLVQTADKLARLATDTETERVEVEFDWASSLPPGIAPAEVDLILDDLAAQVVGGLEELEPPEVDDAP